MSSVVATRRAVRLMSSFIAVVWFASSGAIAGQTRIGAGDDCLDVSHAPVPAQKAVRLRISRELAAYVALRLRSTCLKISEATSEGGPLAASKAALSEVAKQAMALLGPLYAAHPSLRGKSADDPLYQKLGKASPKANAAILSFRSASWLERRISKLGKAIIDSVKAQIDRADDKEAALSATNTAADIAAELSFASMIAYDAYPSFWRRAERTALETTPGRTAESDAAFRKSAPPLGSVRLTEAAHALVKAFYAQLHKEQPSVRFVVSMIWAEGARSRRPNDKDWTNLEPGPQLGADPREHYPPDVIDRVDGVEIVFSAPDPRIYEGKTIDVRDHRLFVRD
jgi:hypothetical protein